MMMKRTILPFLCAVLLAYVLAAFFSTQINLDYLTDLNAEIPLGLRLETIAHDLWSMALTGPFLIVIGIGLAIAFPVASLILRYKRDWRFFGYILAGAAALACIHLLLKSAFDISAIGAARQTGGFLLQCVAGAAGGWLFERMTRGSRQTVS